MMYVNVNMYVTFMFSTYQMSNKASWKVCAGTLVSRSARFLHRLQSRFDGLTCFWHPNGPFDQKILWFIISYRVMFPPTGYLWRPNDFVEFCHVCFDFFAFVSHIFSLSDDSFYFFKRVSLHFISLMPWLGDVFSTCVCGTKKKKYIHRFVKNHSTNHLITMQKSGGFAWICSKFTLSLSFIRSHGQVSGLGESLPPQLGPVTEMVKVEIGRGSWITHTWKHLKFQNAFNSLTFFDQTLFSLFWWWCFC